MSARLTKHGDLDYRGRPGELWSHHGRYYVLWSDDTRTELPGDTALIDAISDLLVNHPRLRKKARLTA